MNLLSPFGWLYGLGADARNAMYDRGLFHAHHLGARTISVGNITAGGTGKTPLVAVVAEILAENGEKVCILTRGYGRRNPGQRVLVSDGVSVMADAATGGDEPVELARRLLGKAALVADANRVSAATWARENLGITAFVLDDGFQHRRAKRDLDIVCVDATNPFGGGEVLPAGTLREPVGNLARADVVVITRSNLVASTDDLVLYVRQLNPSAQIFNAAISVSGVSRLQDFLAGTGAHENGETQCPVAGGFLFCGLGNPESLRTQLANEGVELAGFRKFPDHHIYSIGDIERLETEAKTAGADSLLTTGKDALKLPGLEPQMPCFVITSSFDMTDREAFAGLVAAV